MESLTKYINRISRCYTLYRNGKLEHESINGYQHVYILHLCTHPGMTQEQIAQAVYVNKSSVTRQLALLEKTGFITRTPSISDKRALQVYPTEKAYALYPKVKRLSEEYNSYLYADFTEEERDQLITMLKRVTEKAVARLEKEEETCERY